MLFASAQAGALTLMIESSGGTTIVVGDNTADDEDLTVGVVRYSVPIDSFLLVSFVGISKPVVGDPTKALLKLAGVSMTGAVAGTLTISLSDADFLSGSGDTTLTSEIGGTTDGTTSFQSFLDPGNTEFETTVPPACTSGLQGPFGPGAYDDTVSTVCTVTGDFAVTTVAVAALTANSIQSFGSSTMADIPEEQVLACRFTGGGVDTDGNWNHELEDGEMIRNGAGNLPAGTDRSQFGGQVGANTALPQEKGEWQHHQQRGPSGAFSFHGGTASAAEGTRITDIRCSDPGWCAQARPAPVKQLDFDAIGTFSNVGKGPNTPTFEIANPNVIPEPNGKGGQPFTFHWFEVNIDDLGEPGNLNSGAPDSDECPGLGFGEKSAGDFNDDLLPFTELANCDCPDFYRITIYKGVLSTEVTYLGDPADGIIDPDSMDKSTVIYQFFGYPDGGNLQIHPPTGFDTN